MILLSCLTILISLLVFYPSFHIGLYGDDWLAIFRYVVHVSPFSKEGWNLLTYYLTPYGSQDILMGLLYSNFGTNAFYYEITSYIFRLIAAFSLYPTVFYLTKNKLSAFFAILFFSITTTGLDSTGWLLTMPTYLTIAFFNLFLYFYIRSKDEKKIKNLLISGLFFYLAYITAPARMIGAPLFILFMEVFWLFQNHTLKTLRVLILRISFIFSIMFIIGISGHSLGNSGDWFGRLSASSTTIQNLLKEGRSEFFLYPIVTIGGMFIPNFAFPNIQINTKSDMLLSVFLPALTIFLLVLTVLKTNIKILSMNDIYKGLLTAAIWILIVFIVRKLNIINFSSSNLILMAIAGGFTIILWILLSYKYHTHKKILTALVLSFSWTLLSFFIAWFWNPVSYIDSTHRYLTTSAVGVSIFLAVIIAIGVNKRNQLYLACLLSLLLILHITSTKIYINKLLNSHSQQTVDKIWSAIPRIANVGKEPLVFYFEAENTNNSILGDAVMFGFPFHIALLYNLTEAEIIPVPMQNWEEVISATRDGKSFKAYGYPQKPILINQVYAFRLQGKDNLINITDPIRQKLTENSNKF